MVPAGPGFRARDKSNGVSVLVGRALYGFGISTRSTMNGFLLTLVAATTSAVIPA